MTEQKKPQAKAKPMLKEDKRAEALRENLKKRKLQQKQRNPKE